MGRPPKTALPVGRTEISQLMHISLTTLGNLDSAGVIEHVLVKENGKDVRKYYKEDTMSRYIRYLQDRVNKKAQPPDPDGDAARKLKADADLKEAKAEIEEMKRDELRGRLHLSEDVEKMTGRLVAEIRGELLALPGTCAVDVAMADTPREAAGLLKRAVYPILERLKDFSYDREAYKKLVRQREEWMNDDPEEDTDGDVE